ncbi:MAG: flagellar basal body rod protein FlgB [Thermodesulfobacteriota bacterium]
MTDSFLFDKTHALLSKSLDVAARRNSLITGNIANVDTIGYQPRDIDFQATLKQAMETGGSGMRRTDPRHLPFREAEIDMAGTVRGGEADAFHLDSVDIDTEMTHLIENNIQYRTSVELLLRRIGILRQSITEGGR